ncbi:hypothetical protein I3900191A7_18980 [Clostridium baratii]|uniref:hypothetical protein n=1 Tax=Clostridium baratii TaxID=1561 RepID=UPI0036F33EFB
MKKETSIVPFEIAVKNMEYNIPEDPQNTTKTGRSSVKNAWNNCTYIDSMGIMWIEKSRIDGILRTNKATAKYVLKDIPDSSRTSIAGKEYFRAYEIGKILDEFIQKEGVGRRKEYLKYSEKIYKAIRDSDTAENIRTTYIKQIQDSRKNLKNKRIRKYKIRKDELTGEKLIKKTAEFSHIRSYALFKDIADDIENGLIVNKETHEIITKRGINDEVELYRLCEEMDWDIEWIKKFKKYFDI